MEEFETIWEFQKCRIDMTRYVEGKLDIVFLTLHSLHNSEILSSISELEVSKANETVKKRK